MFGCLLSGSLLLLHICIELLILSEADWIAGAACKDRARALPDKALAMVPTRVTIGQQFPTWGKLLA